MKVLVTGAAGFIGSNLSRKLLTRGDEVVGIDNFNDYYDPSIKQKNITSLQTFNQFKLINGDIRDRQAILDLFEAEGFDAVAHLAAMAGVRNAVKYPALYIEVDYNGTQNLMDGARFNQVQNFVFASTSSVYGETQQIPFVETDPCDRPLQPYAAAKRASEILGYTYKHLFDLNFTATRFFTVYGPGNRPDMMAYLLADSIHNGKQIPLYNEGNMYRDWTFVDDITDGLMLAIDKPLGFEVINLGRGEPTLLRNFIDVMESVSGGKGTFIHRPKLAADVIQTYADISKARRLLGYDPQVSIKEGVQALWDWFVQNQPQETAA